MAAPMDTDNSFLSKQAYLNTLLLRPEAIQPELIEQLEMFGVFLGSGFFLEMLFAPLTLDHSLLNDETNIFRRLEAALHRMFYGRRLFYTSIMGGYFICLFCFPHIKTEDEATAIRDTLCREVRPLFTEVGPFAGKVTAIVGPTCQGRTKIYDMHNVNMEVFQYLRFVEAFPPFFVLGGQTAPMSSQFEEMKQISALAGRFAVSIKAGESIPRELYEQFYAYLVDKQAMTLRMVHFHIFVFLNNLLLLLYEFSIVDREFLEQHAVYQTMAQSQTIRIFRSRFENFIDDLMTLSKRRQRRLSPLKSDYAEIYKTYIDSNITDPLLDVASAAEAMNVSQPLLSTVFKRKFEISPSDYIRSARIALVKKLLSETDLTLVQIASCTGFSSITTLQRTFRRMEGIPPGKYRTVHHSENKAVSDDS